MPASHLRAVVVLAATAWSLASTTGRAEIDFQRQIRPILSNKCFTCHGPDDAAREAGLRLDVADFSALEADSGEKPIVPGSAEKSEVVRRITSDDEAERMPPVETKKPLTAAEIETLKTWIDEGAKYKQHWAFVAPQKPAPPEAGDSTWPRTEVDRFVLARLTKEGLAPSPEASKETLLRRLSLDLIGLPPTVEEIDAFLADESPDAYRRQVERLLASPHYGERWGRVWLDGARYADSDGYEKDLPRSMWLYRDWVVRALNGDMPYDQFLTRQLAGDLLPDSTYDDRLATGYLRNSSINEEGGIDPEQFRMEGNFERMDILGKSVLGLTINCCQCHSHKYDPIAQEEYYRLMAYVNKAEEVTVAGYAPEQELVREEVLSQIAEVESQLKARRPDWRDLVAAWADQQRGNQPKWESFPVKHGGDNSERFIYNDDDSMTGWGYNPPQLTAPCVGRPGARRVTAFRVEAMLDPILPLGGPGRSPDGKFAVTEISLEVLGADPSAAPRPVKIASATADFANEPQLIDKIYEESETRSLRVTGPVSYALDGNPLTAWGVDAGPGRSNVARQAVFVLAEPLDVKADESLRFSLVENHGGRPDSRTANSIGRIRFSTTDAPNAAADPLPARVRQIVERDASTWTDADRDELFTVWRTTVPEWLADNQRIEELWRQHPPADTQLEFVARATPRATHVLERGNFLSPAREVEPGVLSALHPLPNDCPPDRLGLARWLTDRRSPTTSRAIVNRVWQSYFGVGLVDTPEDFGLQGSAPTHPELLDWLAVEFMDRGWKLKDLHRLIVDSAVYRQSSRTNARLLEIDAANRLLARGPRFRVDGETVRDIALTASGLLNPRLGGPSVFPPTPAFLFLPPASFGPKSWIETTGPERYRRSLYTFRYRSSPNPVLTTFDAPVGDSSCVRRTRSNTPLQALISLNEKLSMECARGLAWRSLEAPGDDAERLTTAWRRCTGRRPQPDELRELLAMLVQQRTAFGQPSRDPWLLLADDGGKRPLLPLGATAPDAAAWTAVSRLLLNLDETITKE